MSNPDENRCPECGLDIPAASPGGICPRCALRATELPTLEMGADFDPSDFPRSTEPLPPASASLDTHPESIGPYRILSKLAEGGMGQVYIAEQRKPIRRKVALKVIKPGMDSREVLARFEAERQAVALMDHPGIAKIFDAGSIEGGTPYFVMELVEGGSVTEYCDAKKLSLRERLQLFRRICEAIQHAHQKGIIHRDIKPSNILVTEGDDGSPQPMVIDFGVAKALGPGLTEKTLFTEMGQLLGTPQYMSPEQANLDSKDVDTRSDIYSLGILLYELMTGRAPMEASTLRERGLEEMLRIIREEEPPRPSTRIGSTEEKTRTAIAESRRVLPAKLGPSLRGDLDWIAMKALDKDRNRRYETANAFALDISRYLEDEPVVARPPSIGYQFTKFAKRNKAFLTTAALVAIAVIGGAVISIWQAVRATRAEHLAITRLEESEASRQRAEASRQRAEATSGFMIDVFQTASAAEGESEITVLDALDTAVGKLNRDLADQPQLWTEIARELAKIYFGHGNNEKAADLSETITARLSDDLGENHPETISAKLLLAQSLHKLKRYANAQTLLEELLVTAGQSLGPDHPTTHDISTTLISNLYWSGKEKAAKRRIEEWLEDQGGIEEVDMIENYVSLETLGAILHDEGQYAESLALRERLLEDLLKRSPEHPRTFNTMASTAVSYQQMARYDEAIGWLEQSLAGRERSYGPSHPVTIQTLNQLANAHGSAGNELGRQKFRARVVNLHNDHLGPDHPQTLVSKSALAASYDRTGRTQEATDIRTEVLESLKAAIVSDDPALIKPISSLAIYLTRSGQHEEAHALRRKGLELAERVHGADSLPAVIALNDLSFSEEKFGRYEEALAMRERAHGLICDLLPESDLRRLRVTSRLADLLEKVERHAEALPYRETVYELMLQGRGADDREAQAARKALIAALGTAGRHKEADSLGTTQPPKSGEDVSETVLSGVIKDRQAVLERQKALDSQELAEMSLEALRDLARDYRMLGVEYENLNLFRKAALSHEKSATHYLSLFESGSEADAGSFVIASFSAGQKHMRSGDHELALDWLEKVVDFSERTNKATLESWQPTIRGHCAYAAYLLGVINQREERWVLAEASYRKSLELWQQPNVQWVTGIPSTHYAIITKVSLASLYAATDRADSPEVDNWLTEAIELFRPLVEAGSVSPEIESAYKSALRAGKSK